MKKRILALLLVLMMVLTMAACTKDADTPATDDTKSSTEATDDATTEDEVTKDTLILGSKDDADSLDPHVQNDGYSEQAVSMLYNTLLKFEVDGSVVGDIATEWSVSDDSLTWTFKLRDDVKFSNGKALTANDVKATYDRFMVDSADAAALVVKEVTKMFVSVDVIDDYTVSITTDAPYGPMASLLSNRSLAIMDEDVFNEFGYETGTSIESTVGTGAYVVTKWSVDEEMVFEANPYYFGDAPAIENVIWRVIPEDAAAVIALENGEVDMLKSFPSEDLERLEANEDINIVLTNSVGARLFRFGCDDEIMSDPLVRQAIVYAIDRTVIIEGLFPGLTYETTGPMTNAVWGYTDLGAIKQDQAKSKELLAQAGYPDGFETKIVTTDRYPKGVEMAEILSAQLAEVGITAAIENLEWSVLLPTWLGITPEEFDEPIFIMGAGTSMMDADGALRGLYTTTETGTNERNYGFYSNAEVDKLVADGMTETDLTKRAALYQRASEILYLEDPTAIWLFDKYNTIAARNDVKGIACNGVGLLEFDSLYFE